MRIPALIVLPTRRARASADGTELAGTEEPAHLVGWLPVEVPAYRRARHVGYIVLGVGQLCAAAGPWSTSTSWPACWRPDRTPELRVPLK